ncbi:hypothetical protein MBCUT_10910 [Methanobrevibacter cuticularis]|uniref:PRC-barrel domain-containing protein n=1 Tax=Methanobrevibacter cuticularis TaxID=47311 RepID=A0A166DXP2_9EURY|nr:PRC-barrel domain-containing protein [Methanobrevibacter cuticularis]KZX16062.1 hypothetical protein MBCUT_10910 [Methanobrevibacter cuticularis]
MNILKILGMSVVDKQDKYVGIVNGININEQNYSIDEIDIKLNQQSFSELEGTISFD